MRLNAIAVHIVTDLTCAALLMTNTGRPVTDRISLAYVGEPRDIGGPVIFLALDASRFVTGHTLVIDGGWTMT